MPAPFLPLVPLPLSMASCPWLFSSLPRLERSYVPNVGNAVRLYLARLEGANVIGVESIATERAVPKTLVLDFATLPAAHIAGAPNHLPNFEGLALGPKRSDGSRVLFVISDDNGLAELVTRILVLAIRGLR